MKRMTRIKQIIVIMLVFAFATPSVLWADEKPAPALKPAVRVAVVPFKAVAPEDHSSTAQCPICGSVNSAGSITKGAEKVFQDLCTDKLKGLKNAELISSEKSAAVYQRVSAASLKKTLLQTLTATGLELQADVLVAGYLYHYRERVGYDYSAERPASVAFEIHLISVKDGSTIWRGIYDRTQKSLMEDVFQVSSFVKGGAKWLTARELTKLGVDEVFTTFSGFEP